MVAAGAVVVLSAVGGSGQEHEPPPLKILRGPHERVEANLQPIARRIASRVERLRGLEFRRRPRVVVMGLRRLTAVGRGIARTQRRHAENHPTRLRADRRLERASTEFDQLAGLLPPESGLGPDTRATGLDRIGGAYDFPRERVVIVPALIETRIQLHYTLAHELTHVLEDQHFGLRLGRLTAPSAAAEARRAVIEGTATFVQDLYRRRYLDDAVPLRSRIDAMRSVIAAGPGPYAVNAQAVFDYVDGGLFVYELYRRAGGFRLIDRALRRPPKRADQILHPRSWPAASRNPAVRLGVAPILRSGWRPVGGGVADEQRARVILLAGTIVNQASTGASGWTGGRFAVWRAVDPPDDCEDPCHADVGVIAFRWRHSYDAEEFALAVPAYMTLGVSAENLERAHAWRLTDGYVALGAAARASALAFAPTESLARALSRRAARVAEASCGRSLAARRDARRAHAGCGI
jgi:hypothetical protein